MPLAVTAVLPPISFFSVIGSQSRQDLAELFDRKVHLFLFVKVRENWLNDPERYREMGLELG